MCIWTVGQTTKEYYVVLVMLCLPEYRPDVTMNTPTQLHVTNFVVHILYIVYNIYIADIIKFLHNYNIDSFQSPWHARE